MAISPLPRRKSRGDLPLKIAGTGPAPIIFCHTAFPRRERGNDSAGQPFRVASLCRAKALPPQCLNLPASTPPPYQGWVGEDCLESAFTTLPLVKGGKVHTGGLLIHRSARKASLPVHGQRPCRSMAAMCSFGSVAFIAGEVISGVYIVVGLHYAVPRGLSYDGCRRYAYAFGITRHYRLCGVSNDGMMNFPSTNMNSGARPFSINPPIACAIALRAA